MAVIAQVFEMRSGQWKTSWKRTERVAVRAGSSSDVWQVDMSRRLRPTYVSNLLSKEWQVLWRKLPFANLKSNNWNYTPVPVHMHVDLIRAHLMPTQQAFMPTLS